MSEEEWLECDNPTLMLDYVHGRASDRKLRLFACACCRRVWNLLLNQGARDAVETMEHFAEGLLSEDERVEARKAAQRAAQSRTPGSRLPDWQRRAASVVYKAAARQALDAAWNSPQLAIEALVWLGGGYVVAGWEAIERTEKSLQATALRDIFGNPFRPVALDPAWRSPTVASLAQCIYLERELPSGHLDVSRLAMLADALEEAGCARPAILTHLRSPGPHVRGCWPLDLVLAKE